MSEQALRRTDEILIELVEMVETARTLPMSSSCVLPRERTLDLLDELRDRLPNELAEARKLMGTRDQVLRAAHEKAADIVKAAEVQAHQIVQQGHTEHAALVSASGVHRSAVEQADRIVLEVRQYDARVRQEADAYAAKLTADATDYADRTLAELVQTLQRTANVAERGRAALAKRTGNDRLVSPHLPSSAESGPAQPAGSQSADPDADPAPPASDSAPESGHKADACGPESVAISA